MSNAHTLHDLAEPQAGESTLFDSLARLVPEELQTAYYRVLAHTRTLSPDDEISHPQSHGHFGFANAAYTQRHC